MALFADYKPTIIHNFKYLYIENIPNLKDTCANLIVNMFTIRRNVPFAEVNI